MKSVICERTRFNPEISYNDGEKRFSVEGISTIVNAYEFYDLAITWLNLHSHNLEGKVEFRFHLTYFNSASMKGILMLMARIKKGIESGKAWSIAWNVEDDDEFLLDACESFQEMLGIELRIVRS